MISPFSPHSLGILIEWKLGYDRGYDLGIDERPHSLGILIEWKRKEFK